MKKIAVFPGSFDPFTIGHEAIVKRALIMFDEIIIAVGANALKKSFYPVDTRKKMIGKVFQNEPRVKVDHYEGLTVDYCKKNGADFMLRGLRTAADFEFERAIAQVNKAMAPDIESVFIAYNSGTFAILTPLLSGILYEAEVMLQGLFLLPLNLKDYKGDEDL